MQRGESAASEVTQHQGEEGDPGEEGGEKPRGWKLAVLVAVIGLAGSFAGGVLGAMYSASETRSLESDRYVRDAYVSYMASVSEMQEHLWNNVWWIDAADLNNDLAADSTDEDLKERYREEFWPDAKRLQRDLRVGEENLRLMLPDESLGYVDALEDLRMSVYSDFRCKAGLIEECSRYVAKTAEDLLETADSDFWDARAELREEVRNAIQVDGGR